MPIKDLFQKAFDKGTNTKLEILKNYFEEWLPVFVAREAPIWNTIQIFDFFAGRGTDKNGVDGSPFIFIKIIESLRELIVRKELKVILHLNELKTNNYQALLKNISDQDRFFEIRTYNQSFNLNFQDLYPSMIHSANFLFFDQNGIKEITKPIFEKIIELKKTDFLLFISSSYFQRFSSTPEFKRYFNLDKEFIQSSHYYHIHRKVLQHYKSFIPANKKYFLAPFSIKKDRNIYGLIFGTNHTLGIEKFLKVCWRKDALRGEANYDIDNEKISKGAPFLFDELNKPLKIDVFEKGLINQIFDNKILSLKKLYLYTLDEGFQYKDTNKVLLELKRSGKIYFNMNLINSSLHKVIEDFQIEIRL